MKKGLLGLGVFALLAIAQSAFAVMSKDSQVKHVFGVGPKVEYFDGEFVVQMAKTGGASVKTLSRHLAQMGMTVVEAVNKSEDLYLAKSVNASKTTQLMGLKGSLSKEAFTKSVIAHLSVQQDVEFVEPNFIYRALDVAANTPNDSMFSQLWGMKNLGQNDSEGAQGVSGADIKAPEAWALGTGSKNVVVAVIDTGVDYTHTDLKDNIWSKPGQANVHGHNAIDNSDNSMDDNNHGTHCSGTIGGMGNNGIGVAGVNWNVSIMGVKFLTKEGSGSLADAVKAIDWATANGAQILSNSWGGGGFSQAMQDSIKRANDKGVLFIAAAGNDGSNNDATPSYPASYPLDNVISVAASTNQDSAASFSNIGLKTVHLMAPGNNIVSTVPGNKYDSYSGTSMATPHVAGAAALLWAKEPSLTAAQVKERLMSSTDKIKSMRKKLLTSGRLNIFNLLANINPPAFVPVPESSWSALIPNAIETAHPYANSFSNKWEISHEGAKYLRVHFLSFNSESGYDNLTITSESGQVTDTITGDVSGAFWSGEIEGSKATLEFKSDSSVNAQGFVIDGISWSNFSGN